MPGCTHTKYLEFHHITPWEEGGETNLNNLIPLCSACHAEVTNGYAAIAVEEGHSDRIRFRFPGGISFTSFRRTIPMANAAIIPPLQDGYLSGPVPRGEEWRKAPDLTTQQSFEEPTDLTTPSKELSTLQQWDP